MIYLDRIDIPTITEGLGDSRHNLEIPGNGSMPAIADFAIMAPVTEICGHPTVGGFTGDKGISVSDRLAEGCRECL